MFTWWQALILGSVQGFTEFLPISSSGHLVLFHSLLGLRDLPLSFDVLTHLGTLVAVFVFFWPRIKKTDLQYWGQVGIATIPAVIIGLAGKDAIESTAYNSWVLGTGFLVSALFLFICDSLLRQDAVQKRAFPMMNVVDGVVARIRRWQNGEATERPTWLQSLLIGSLQALALLPSVSRSGSALLGGLVSGLSREEAFNFAFLISIPVILGANVIDLIDVWQSGEFAQIPWGVYLLGIVTAGVTGFFSLGLLKRLMTNSRLDWFAWYLVAVSIVSFLFV